MTPDPIFSGLNSRRLTEQDVPTLVAIEQAAHQHPWNRQQFHDCLKADYLCHGFSIPEDDTLAAYWVLQRVLDEIEILNICVSPKQQGKGIGKQLLNGLIDMASQQQVKRLLLEVRQSNVIALNLYRSVGFKQVGKRKNYYSLPTGGHEHAVLMTCHLGA